MPHSLTTELEGARSGARGFWLEHDGRRLNLTNGTMLIGRSPNCHLVLEDSQISRRHAQIFVTAEGVSIEDLHSINGVLVNGQRIEGTSPLWDGDVVQIGRQTLLLHGRKRTEDRILVSGRVAVHSDATELAPPDIVLPLTPSKNPVHHRPESLEIIGTVAEKVLQVGRGDEAERLLTGSLHAVLSAVKTGALPALSLAERGAELAVKLADVTGRGRWIDYAVELYTELRRPLPAEIVDQLYMVIRKTSDVSRERLRAYLRSLHSSQAIFGPNERFLVQRIEGLERLAALK